MKLYFLFLKENRRWWNGLIRELACQDSNNDKEKRIIVARGYRETYGHRPTFQSFVRKHNRELSLTSSAL